MSDVTVTGLSELQALLDTLPVKIEANIMRGALRAGAKPMMQEAKDRVSVASGKLRDGLKITTRKSKGQVIAKIVATGAHRSIAHLVEFGTRPHQIKAKDGGAIAFGGGMFSHIDHPGARPRPFMRPAFDAKAEDAVIAAGEYVKKRLTKEGLDTSEILVDGDEP